jgi:hypothetical protein
MEFKPILLICGCTKYKQSLLAAIRRMEQPEYRIIGIIGNPEIETSFDETSQLLTLKIEDTYEALPLKLQAAFAWIYKEFPDSPGVFKTDDDIYFKNYSILANKINKYKDIPYWCIKKDSCTQHLLHRKTIKKRYTKKRLDIYVPRSTYCWGAGYWLSRKSMNYIIKSDELHYGPEDVFFGHLLNKHKIIPESIKIDWKTKKRTIKH